MAQKSKTEWTESTWIPVTESTKINAGCKNCRAELMARSRSMYRSDKLKSALSEIQA